MKRTHLAGTLFVVILIAAVYPAITSSSHDPVGTAPVVDLQAAATEDALCADPGFSAAPEAETVACSRCPDGSPQCFSDKQCDTLCGTGKGTGVCQRINSCYKCCLCAVAAIGA